MTTTAHHTSASALTMIERIVDPSDEPADRIAAVIEAQFNALTWVYNATERYPAPGPVAAALNEVAAELRSGVDDRDPVAVLHEVAADALAAYRTNCAA